MKIQIVFENEFFILVDKEAMVLTTPARTGAADPRPCLGTALQAQLGQQIFPVHRLDFEVSGLVIFAKTAKAHAQANAWFEHKTVFKTYQAITQETETSGRLPIPGEELLWKSRLLRGKRRTYEHELGKPSETLAVYRGVDTVHPNWHRWELHPLTGRPHQLRYELYRHGFPVVGDALYGSTAVYDEGGIALRAIQVDLRKATAAKEFGLEEFISVSKLF